MTSSNFKDYFRVSKVATCSSKIKFCRAAILSSFCDGEAATWASPQQQQESMQARLEPMHSAEQEGHLHLPTRLSLGLCAPWKMHRTAFPRDKHWGRNGPPLPRHRHTLMQSPGLHTVFNPCYRVSLKQIFTKSSLLLVSACNAKI